VRSFGSDDLLYGEGQESAVVLFPLDGMLQMSKTAPRGRRQVLCNVDSQGCGGICLLMMPDKGPADVRALEGGSVLALDREVFQRLARTDPLLCQAGWRGAAMCLSHLSNLVENLSFHKVSQRVALMLLESTQKNGDLVRRTQADLAAEVGTTREVVARCLAGMQTSGAIRLGRGRITVMKRELLSLEV
jgi:CRP-like cAMP-binding protein